MCLMRKARSVKRPESWHWSCSRLAAWWTSQRETCTSGDEGFWGEEEKVEYSKEQYACSWWKNLHHSINCLGNLQWTRRETEWRRQGLAMANILLLTSLTSLMILCTWLSSFTPNNQGFLPQITPLPPPVLLLCLCSLQQLLNAEWWSLCASE